MSASDDLLQRLTDAQREHDHARADWRAALTRERYATAALKDARERKRTTRQILDALLLEHAGFR